MDKIPEGAESLTVLVGGVKFLSEPIVAFVRLAQVRGVSLLSIRLVIVAEWVKCDAYCTHENGVQPIKYSAAM